MLSALCLTHHSTKLARLLPPAAVICIEGDDFFRNYRGVVGASDDGGGDATAPAARVYEMAMLPWPGGQLPACFPARRLCTNSIETLDVPRLVAAFEAALAQQPAYVFVDSFLLLHMPAIVGRLDALVRCGLRQPNADPHGELFMLRKYHRRHRDNPSYCERGATIEQYRVYWEHCVWPRYLEYRAAEPPLAAHVVCFEVDTEGDFDAAARDLLTKLDSINKPCIEPS